MYEVMFLLTIEARFSATVRYIYLLPRAEYPIAPTYSAKYTE